MKRPTAWTLKRLRKLVRLAWNRHHTRDLDGFFICPVCLVVLQRDLHKSDCHMAEILGAATQGVRTKASREVLR